MCPWTLRLPVAGNTCSLPFLSSSSSFPSFSPSLSLSLFLSSLSLSFLPLPGCPWMLSSWLGTLFWCVLGRLRRSWEHLLFLSILLFLSSLLSLPLPPSRAMRSHTKEVLQQVFNEVWLHWFSSPPFGPLFILLLHTHLFSSFLSCPPVFMSWHNIPSFFCAHIGPGLSVYARIFTYF